MTGPENERLAVLETQYKTLQNDVSEIKSDVKALVANQQAVAQALATKQALDTEARAARASNGVWVRTFLPLILMALALTLSVVNALLNALSLAHPS